METKSYILDVPYPEMKYDKIAFILHRSNFDNNLYNDIINSIGIEKIVKSQHNGMISKVLEFYIYYYVDSYYIYYVKLLYNLFCSISSYKRQTFR